jgi:hypothetical protein
MYFIKLLIMKLLVRSLFCIVVFFGTVLNVLSQSDNLFKIYQFPPDHIPRIDGKTDDWQIVTESYCIGMNFLVDDEKIHPEPDSSNLNVKVRVGWVKGMNRLYFLYEAYDDYWDFSHTGLHHDIFEVVVDGDMSGGPFIEQFHPGRDSLYKWDLYFSFHGVHAQNYHIFTPAEGKDWCMLWGSQQWLKELPYANYAFSYDFRPGESGKLILEFWITPFDTAHSEGPALSKESILSENKEIGLSWAVIDWDDVDADSNNGFWNLSDEHTMYGNASYLKPFRLMPLEEEFISKFKADWSFKIIDMNRRKVEFIDLSDGEISSWKWDFGDGAVSEEQNPIHTYSQPGTYIVTLWIEGPAGKARMARVWDVVVR